MLAIIKHFGILEIVYQRKKTTTALWAFIRLNE